MPLDGLGFSSGIGGAGSTEITLDVVSTSPAAVDTVSVTVKVPSLL